MPGRNARDDAFLALRGASYHFWQLRDQFQRGLVSNEQTELFHWHLRGFFWEMIAIRDSLARNPAKDAKIEVALQALESTGWFQELVAYRNFAHQSFHIVEALVPKATGKVAALQLQRALPTQGLTGDAIAQLEAYWHEMDGFFKTFFS